MKISSAKIEAFASREEQATIAMRCVYLDCESGRLMATDGHFAARVSIGLDDGDVSGLLPVEVFDLARKELKLIQKAIDKGQIPDSWLRIQCGEDAVIIENLLSRTNHIVNRPKLGDREYPNVDAVFPEGIGAPTVTLSRDLLSTVLSALDGDAAASIWCAGSEKPTLIAPASGKVLALLMPMRAEADAQDVLARGAAVEVAEAVGA